MNNKVLLREYYELCEGGVCQDFLTESEKQDMDASTVTFLNLFVLKTPFTITEPGTYRVVATVFEVIPDTEPPSIKKHVVGAARDGNIVLTFSEDMDISTFTDGNIVVTGSSSGIHSCDFDPDQLTYTLTVDPKSDFDYDETVTVTVSTGVQDLAGNPLDPQYSFSFQIQSTPWFVVGAWAGQNGSVSPDEPEIVTQGAA